MSNSIESNICSSLERDECGREAPLDSFPSIIAQLRIAKAKFDAAGIPADGPGPFTWELFSAEYHTYIVGSDTMHDMTCVAAFEERVRMSASRYIQDWKEYNRHLFHYAH